MFDTTNQLTMSTTKGRHPAGTRLRRLPAAVWSDWSDWSVSSALWLPHHRCRLTSADQRLRLDLHVGRASKWLASANVSDCLRATSTRSECELTSFSRRACFFCRFSTDVRSCNTSRGETVKTLETDTALPSVGSAPMERLSEQVTDQQAQLYLLHI